MKIQKEKNEDTRRVFLKKFLKYFFLISTISFPIIGISILKPSNLKKIQYIYYEIPEDKIPKEGVRKVDVDIEYLQKSIKIYLVKNVNSITALSPVCTHLGCFVKFDRFTQEFICPCHGGRYNIEGKVLSGPPKEALQRLPVKMENGKILIEIKI